MAIDHFNAIDNQYGYHADDDVLHQFEMLFQITTRQAYPISRYRGEVFALVQPETRRVEGRQIGEEIGERVKRHDGSGPVTVSGGEATYANAGDTDTELLKATDELS